MLQKLDEVRHALRLGLAAPVQAEEYRENGLYLEGIVKTEDLHCFEGYLV